MVILNVCILGYAIVDPPAMWNLSATNAERNVRTGGEANFLCPFENVDHFTWFKVFTLKRYHFKNVTLKMMVFLNVLQDNVNMTEHVDQPIIRFSAVVEEDHATYTCLVENAAGLSNYTFHLNVMTPPQILTNNGNTNNEVNLNAAVELTAEAGEPVEIECLASGYPMPKVKVSSFRNRFEKLLLPYQLQISVRNSI